MDNHCSRINPLSAIKYQQNLPTRNKYLHLHVYKHYTALENKLEIIITRNKKDFKTSKLAVLTAREYLNR